MDKVKISHLTKEFPQVGKIVKDFNLNIAPGEFVILVGPSGCGKSTVLNMIAGLEPVSSGTITIEGKDVTALSPKQRDIAMVFQSYALYPHMTVRENIAFPLTIAKLPKKEIAAKVYSIAKTLDIVELLDKKPAKLSGGQRQRVAMGRALVRHPKLFLMDEPLSNLDAKLRVQMRAEISRLHELMKVSTLYVTHDQVEAMTLADRIVVINKGEIQQIGTPETLYANPANIFVATFIGSPGMNIFSAELKGNTIETKYGNLQLTPAQSTELAGLLSQNTKLAVGLRPENIKENIDNLETDFNFSAKTIHIESLGSDTYLHFADPSSEFLGLTDNIPVARMKPQQHYGTGSLIQLSCPKNELKLFCAETGKSLDLVL